MTSDWKRELSRLTGHALPSSASEPAGDHEASSRQPRRERRARRRRGGRAESPEAPTRRNREASPPLSEGRETQHDFEERLAAGGFWDPELAVPTLLDLAERFGKNLADVPSWRLREETLEALTGWLRRIQRLAADFDGDFATDGAMGRYARAKAELMRIQAEVMYNVGRGRISRNLKDLCEASLRHLIERPREEFPEALRGFCDFFESVYAYFFFFSRQSRR
ncbi:MAG: type III-A CRISPR-associated protein Csm2 [Deltaproteobacteria bacterium]|nr:MAG: type III-A CRISPR-associated protein Csm2 [Deltaproteobacteria bacterium]